MSSIFLDLQNEVKRRATRDQSGTQFTSGINTIINSSLYRVGREANWKQLRRKTSFASDLTIPASTTALVTTATLNSTSFSGSGLLLLTNKVRIGRRINITGSTQRYIITSITSENAFTTNLPWDGTSYSGTGALQCTIYGREDYTLPMQAGRIGLIWHEAYGYPFMMRFLTDFDFFTSGIVIENNNRPVYWRQWGEDDALAQPLAPCVMKVSSSSPSDVGNNITVYGTVNGYPDQETIVANGTSTVSGAKSFTSVERVTKDDTTTVGQISVTANDAGSTIVAVIPVGNIQNRFSYKHIQVWPLPNSSFNFNVYYYKDPSTLVNNNDIHELGGQFDEAIILLAVSKIKTEQNLLPEGQAFFQMYMDELKNLKKYNADTNVNYAPALRRPKNAADLTGGQVARFLNYAQLGGSFGPAWSN